MQAKSKKKKTKTRSRGRVVRQGTATPRTVVRIRSRPLVTVCLGGGIGRRVGLKNQWQQRRMGSTPIPGTCYPMLPYTFSHAYA